MGAHLFYGDETVGEIPRDKNYQSVFMPIKDWLSGELFVYFKNAPNENIPPHFLREEQVLLNQIGHEVSSLIELDTKRKKEKIIQEKFRVTDRLNLVGELTAGIAHELNTTLGNILGYSELLLKSEVDSQKKHDLEKVN